MYDASNDDGDDDDAAGGQGLAVLICSANVGNAEPTPESFAEWIPEDGGIAGPLRSTKYPVVVNVVAARKKKKDDGGGCSGGGEADGDDDDDRARSRLLLEMERDLDGSAGGDNMGVGGSRRFDIIVIGMQEAAFLERKTSSSVDNDGGGGGGGGGMPLMGESNAADTDLSPPSIGPLKFPIIDGISEINREGKKNMAKVTTTVSKASLMLRSLGLTSHSPTVYQSTILKNPSALLPKASLPSKRAGRNDTLVGDSSYDTRIFLELIESRCPSYGIVTSKLRGQMRLIVLALKGLVEEISNVHVEAENTGIGNFLANKGGIIVTLDIRGTRLSFMTAHLEAHEGEAHYRGRNRSLVSILEGAKTDPNYPLQDATIISHHMFVCGDLNYRTNFGVSSAAKKNGNGNTSNFGLLTKKIMTGRTSPDVSSVVSPSSETTPPTLEDVPSSPPNDAGVEDKLAANGSHYDKAISLIDAEDWNALNDGDELAMALKKKECLVGFTTLPCNFPPTFKVARVEGYEYNEKRTPSYTDRILWKSADGLARNVTPFLYEPCPGFITSDHKPIRGGYMVKTTRGPPGQVNKGMTDLGKLNERKVHLLVSDIKCTNLPAMDSAVMGGLSDPFVLFVSYPKSMLWDKGWPSTEVITRNLNPVWKEATHLELDGDARKSLPGSMLYMTVMDEDLNGADTIGTVALNLFDLCCNLSISHSCNLPSPRRGSTMGTIRKSFNAPLDTQITKISTPILRNGQEFGMLECTITSAYLTAKETKVFMRETSKQRTYQRIVRTF